MDTKFRCIKTYYHKGIELMFIKGHLYWGTQDNIFPQNFIFENNEASRSYGLQTNNPDDKFYLFNILKFSNFSYGH
jgi:hypothetical protein